MLDRRTLFALTGGVLASTAMATRAFAGAPHRLARIVVGFPPGGSLDVVARILAENMNGYAESTIVENRAGAGGRLVLQTFKTAPQDGTVVALTPGDQLTLFPHIYKGLPYDALQDFSPVSTVCSVQFLLTVGPLVPAAVTTLRHFLDWCRANPKLANFGTPGAGTRQHFMGMVLARAAKVELVHVPYKGAPPAMQDLVGGHIAANISVASNALPGIAAGQIRALATSAPQRSSVLPQVPTVRETGFPALEAIETFGLLVPRGTAQASISALNAATRRALANRAVLELFAKLGFDAAGSTPDEYATLIRSDLSSWAQTVKDIGFQPLE